MGESVEQYNRQLKEGVQDYSRKQKAKLYADSIVAAYNLSPDKEEVKRGLTTHTAEKDEGQWQARKDIKRAYKEQEAKYVQSKGVYRSKRQGWNKRGPISRRH